MSWEEIEEDLYRTKIPGGWLVKQSSYVIIDNDYHRVDSICFVPDEGHYWKIEEV